MTRRLRLGGPELSSSLIVIRHRCNTIAELEAVSPALGVEIDLRSQGTDLILAHDPFVTGEKFADWLPHFRHRFLILNTKEEGLEKVLLRMLEKAGIGDFFFLDQSFPFLLKTTMSGERRCAVRVSEFESVTTALAMAHLVDWVWVDTFTHLGLSANEARQLKQAGLKLCLVSPELLGRSGPDHVHAIRDELRSRTIEIDAVCTKTPELWQPAAWEA